MSDKVLEYIVSRLNERTEQVGKTTVQKIMYFLKRLGIVDYEYTMHYYGPYSSEVENRLRQLESSNQLRISWNSDRGYFIRLSEEHSDINVDKEKKQSIDHIIENFYSKSAKELSLIATVLYFYPKLPENDIIESVRKLKPQFSTDEISDALNIVKAVF
ncbi:MAG: DUF4065 domain-containing protein [Archaeoglobaceae archaeon]